MIEFFLELNWVIVGQIILIDILLGGDNAIVIALACRHLPPELRFKGIVWGTVGAIGVRIVLIGCAVSLLTVPYLKLVGGLLLLWIGMKLLLNKEENLDDIDGGERLITAIKTILVADLIMSIDNVIAVASAAEQAQADHTMILVVFGIMVSIPIVIWGSTLVLKIMEKIPSLVTLGAALLGYLGGAMIVADTAISMYISDYLPTDLLDFPGLGVHLSLPGIVGAVAVVVAGWYQNRREASEEISQ